MHERRVLLWRIRAWLAFFIVGLVLSGLTAIPLVWEVDRIGDVLGVDRDAPPDQYAGLRHWIARVGQGLRETEAKHPFIAYGTDWLAFAHVMIAVAFVGPWFAPARNRWVIDWGLVACAAVIPWALVFGALRGIPLPWRLLDCSFGVLGAIPLLLVRRDVRRLMRLDAGGG